MTDAYLDSELYVTDRDQARLSFEGEQYSDRPHLSDEWARSLVQPLDPKEYGAAIFSATLVDNLLTGYRIALSRAQKQEARLRLRLHVADTAPAALHALPWELLYDRQRSVALGGSQDVAFSRYLSLDEPSRPPVQERPRLLVALANPRDLPAHLPPMDRERTLEALGRTLKSLAGQMSYEVLDGPTTVARLRERLVEGGFHALHLQAHGLLHAEDSGDATRLVLEDEAGNAALVDQEFLSRLFEGLRTLRLVTLVACHGGKQTGDDPFSGLGPGLVRRGIPAVVAMRQAISFGAAVRFCDHFYRNLARSGCVDAAVSEARNQLFLSQLEESEFGTPVLFMRLADGRLWEARRSEPVLIPADNDIDWGGLVESVRTDSLLPFLGPGLWRGLLPSRSEIAAHWIQEYEKEGKFPLDVRTELPAVAQVVASKVGSRPRERMLRHLADELWKRQGEAESERLRDLPLSEVISRIAPRHFRDCAEDPHRLLAELPLSTYLTTNPDNFLAEALRLEGKRPIREHCPWNQRSDSRELKRYSGLKGTRDGAPLVFHLYGKDEAPSTLVLTEDDHLDFLAACVNGTAALPEDLYTKLTSSMLLFLGYDVRRLDCRVLLRCLDHLKSKTRNNQKSWDRQLPNRIAVLQVDPEDEAHAVELASYMTKCCKQLLINVFAGSVQDFLITLRERWARR